MREMTRRRALSLLIAGGMALVACGSSDGASGDGASPDDTSVDDGASVLSGVVREPAPLVNGTALPSLSDPGTDIEFAANPGEIQVVYFGFTNCPDVCPTTLADLTIALRKLDQIEAGRSDRVETVMVSVDPARDLDILDGYVTSFISDARAAGPDDDTLLMAAGEPFGVSYDVRTLDDGTIEVDHSPFLYAVNDQGELVVSWQFGATSDDMSNDLNTLLDRYEEQA